MARTRLGIGEFGEMSAKRDEKQWRARVRYRDQSGKIRQLGANGATRRKAESSLRQKMSATLLGNPGGALPTENPTLADLGRHWLSRRAVSDDRTKGTIGPSTLEQYEDSLERIIIPSIGQLLVAESTVARLESFLESLIVAGSGSSTALKARTVLRQALEVAVRYGYLESNPVSSVQAIRPAGTSTPKAWSDNEIAQMRQAIAQWSDKSSGRSGPPNLWLPDLLEVMLGTVCRISEGLALSWDRVHIQDGTVPWVRIDRSVREPKRGPHSVGPTKSGDVRELEIPPYLATVLRERRGNALGHEPVFATKKGKWIRPSAAHRAYRSALDAAGIDRALNPHLRPHGARKTAATLIARVGGSKGAAAQLGHSGTKTAELHYIEPVIERIAYGDVLEHLAPPS